MFLVLLFIVIAIIPDSRSSAAEKERLQAQVQTQEKSIRKLSQALTDTQKAKAVSDAELTKKASESTQKQSEIDSLNKQLQAKAAEKERLALATAGRGGVAVMKGGIFYGNDYEWGQCVWYVATRIPVPAHLGNANTWDDNAAALGFAVTSVPQIGAVAQTDAGYYGHVALISAVEGDQVQLDEMNVLGVGVQDFRWVNVNEYKYIYF